MGQALLEEQRRCRPGQPDRLPYYLARNEQAMGARGGRVRPDAEPAPGAGVHRVDRARLHQHAHRELALATINRMPVLLLTSYHFATPYVEPLVLQELEDPRLK